MDGMVIVKDVEQKTVKNALLVYKAVLEQSVRAAKTNGVAPLGVECSGTEFIDALLLRFAENKGNKEE